MSGRGIRCEGYKWLYYVLSWCKGEGSMKLSKFHEQVASTLTIEGLSTIPFAAQNDHPLIDFGCHTIGSGHPYRSRTAIIDLFHHQPRVTQKFMKLLITHAFEPFTYAVVLTVSVRIAYGP